MRPSIPQGAVAPLALVLALIRRQLATGSGVASACLLYCLPQGGQGVQGPGSTLLLAIPRSREVGQSYATSVLTTLRAIAHGFGVVWRQRPEVVS